MNSGAKPEGVVPDIDENGVDLAAIRADLRMTPLERLRAADRRATEAIERRKREAE